MAGMSEVEKLRALAQLDVDAAGAYEAAIARVKEPLIRERLNDFRMDHLRHVHDLNVLIAERGGRPVELRPDFKGAAMKSLTAMSGLMGTEGTLVAMIGNEELTNRTYEAALAFPWSPGVRRLIVKHRWDEERHLMWIREAARVRPWGDDEAGVHA